MSSRPGVSTHFTLCQTYKNKIYKDIFSWISVNGNKTTRKSKWYKIEQRPLLA